MCLVAGVGNPSWDSRTDQDILVPHLLGLIAYFFLRMRIYDHQLQEAYIRLLSFLDDWGLNCDSHMYKINEAPLYIALPYT